MIQLQLLGMESASVFSSSDRRRHIKFRGKKKYIGAVLYKSLVANLSRLVLIVVLVLGGLGSVDGSGFGVSEAEKVEVKSSEGQSQVKAWERVHLGGIPDFVNRAEYIPTLQKIAKYQDEALAGTAGNVKYYRVQGGSGTGASQELLTVQPNGNLTFNSTSNNLNLSTTTREHADYFVQCCRPDAKIIEFEIPKSIDIQMKQAAVPQYKASQNLHNPNGTAPKIVDPVQPGDPFELPSHWHQLIEQNYIQGSAQIIN